MRQHNVLGITTLDYNGNEYILRRILKEHHKPNIEAWKDKLNCDLVLKHDGNFYMCELIPELTTIQDNLEPAVIDETIINEEAK